MKSTKYLFELQTGELFTFMPNVSEKGRTFVALGSVESASKNGYRPFCVFSNMTSRYACENVQVYPSGLLVTKF